MCRFVYLIVLIFIAYIAIENAVAQDPCFQAADSGPCRASIPRFYYDARSSQCNTFTWGGCGGNSNNFDSVGQCQSFRSYCLRRRGFRG